jgi:hypothetical protein
VAAISGCGGGKMAFNYEESLCRRWNNCNSGGWSRQKTQLEVLAEARRFAARAPHTTCSPNKIQCWHGLQVYWLAADRCG